jgi:soluble lytic murein transglycosylase-like protein
MMFWFRREVEAAARTFGLNADIVQAVCLVESSGKTSAYRHEPGFWRRYLASNPKWEGSNPDRVSSSYGLMQVMYPVACEMGFSDKPEALFIPETGLYWGCRHLRDLLEWSHQNIDQALAAYNGGKGGNGQPPYRNANYVAKVRKALTEVQS